MHRYDEIVSILEPWQSFQTQLDSFLRHLIPPLSYCRRGILFTDLLLIPVSASRSPPLFPFPHPIPPSSPTPYPNPSQYRPHRSHNSIHHQQPPHPTFQGLDSILRLPVLGILPANARSILPAMRFTLWDILVSRRLSNSVSKGFEYGEWAGNFEVGRI